MASIMLDVAAVSYMWQQPIVAALLGDPDVYRRLTRELGDATPANHISRVIRTVITGLSNPEQGAYARRAVAAHKRVKVAQHELDNAWLWTTILPLKMAELRHRGLLQRSGYIQPYMEAAVVHGTHLKVSSTVLSLSALEIADLTNAHFANIAKLSPGAADLFWVIMEHDEFRQNFADYGILQILTRVFPPSFAQLFKR